MRDWNGQLRQPILLFDGRNTVSVSPQEGYLHQFSELDTLGYDRPETQCKFDMISLPSRARSALATSPAAASVAFVSNEKGNSVSVVDTDKMETVATFPTGQRPRGIAVSRDGKLVYVALGDDDTVQIFDAKTYKPTGELPSGPDPNSSRIDPAGKFMYAANENDAMVTIIDLDRAWRSGEIAVGVEPEGMSVSPDSKTLICTSETTSMAHFIDTASHAVVANVLVAVAAALFRLQSRRFGIVGDLGSRRRVDDHRSRDAARSRPRCNSTFPACAPNKSSRSASI